VERTKIVFILSAQSSGSPQYLARPVFCITLWTGRGVLAGQHLNSSKMTSLYVSVALFTVGALIGMYLLTFVLQSKNTPKVAVLLHGLFVVLALVLLVAYALEAPGFAETIVLFIVAAVGGLVMVVRDLRSRPFPKWLAIGHGLVAIAGFCFLLMNAFGKD
jgi:hypothetical protein